MSAEYLKVISSEEAHRPPFVQLVITVLLYGHKPESKALDKSDFSYVLIPERLHDPDPYNFITVIDAYKKSTC